MTVSLYSDSDSSSMVISSVSVDTGRTDFTFVVIDFFNSEDTSSDGS